MLKACYWGVTRVLQGCYTSVTFGVTPKTTTPKTTTPKTTTLKKTTLKKTTMKKTIQKTTTPNTCMLLTNYFPSTFPVLFVQLPHYFYGVFLELFNYVTVTFSSLSQYIPVFPVLSYHVPSTNLVLLPTFLHSFILLNMIAYNVKFVCIFLI